MSWRQVKVKEMNWFVTIILRLRGSCGLQASILHSKDKAFVTFNEQKAPQTAQVLAIAPSSIHPKIDYSLNEKKENGLILRQISIRRFTIFQSLLSVCSGLTHYTLLLYIDFVFERFLAPYFIELLMSYYKMYWIFYVNNEPEGKFLYKEAIQMYCTLHCKVQWLGGHGCWCGGGGGVGMGAASAVVVGGGGGGMQEQRFFKSNVSLVISTPTTASVKCWAMVRLCSIFSIDQDWGCDKNSIGLVTDDAYKTLIFVCSFVVFIVFSLKMPVVTDILQRS